MRAICSTYFILLDLIAVTTFCEANELRSSSLCSHNFLPRKQHRPEIGFVIWLRNIGYSIPLRVCNRIVLLSFTREGGVYETKPPKKIRHEFLFWPAEARKDFSFNTGLMSPACKTVLWKYKARG